MSDAYDRLAAQYAEYGATASARIAELEEELRVACEARLSSYLAVTAKRAENRIAELEERLAAAETRAERAEEELEVALTVAREIHFVTRPGPAKALLSAFCWNNSTICCAEDMQGKAELERIRAEVRAAREPGPGDPCATTTEEGTG